MVLDLCEEIGIKFYFFIVSWKGEVARDSIRQSGLPLSRDRVRNITID